MLGMRCVIWDFNGVLVDDEPVHYASFREVLPELTEEAYFTRYLGLSDWGLFRAYTGQEAVDDLVEAKLGAYLSRIDQVRLFDGAADRLRSVPVPQAIASGARRREIDAILTRHDLRQRIEVIVSADDVREGKPDPETYRNALEQLKALHSEIDRGVAVEDAPNGILAAQAAGLFCYAVPTSCGREALRGADRVVEGLQALEDEFYSV